MQIVGINLCNPCCQMFEIINVAKRRPRMQENCNANSGCNSITHLLFLRAEPDINIPVQFLFSFIVEIVRDVIKKWKTLTRGGMTMLLPLFYIQKIKASKVFWWCHRKTWPIVTLYRDIIISLFFNFTHYTFHYTFTFTAIRGRNYDLNHHFCWFWCWLGIMVVLPACLMQPTLSHSFLKIDGFNFIFSWF